MHKLLLSTVFLNCLVWISIIPIWQYPDEQAHFSQVHNFAKTGSSIFHKPDTTLEVSLLESILGTQRDFNGNNKYTYNPKFKINYTDTEYGYFEKELVGLEKSQREKLVKIEATKNPPLYYFLSSKVYKFFENGNIFTRIYALRIFSSVIFLLFIFLSFKIGVHIFKNQLLAYTLTSSLAFTPMFVFASTGILPDVLTNLLFTLVVYSSLKLTGNASRKDFILLGVAIILGLATRQQFLIAIPISLIILSKKILTNQRRILIISTFALSVAVLLFITNFIKGPPNSPVSAFLIIPDGSIFMNTNLSKSSITEHLNFTVGKLSSETFAWYFGIYKWLSLSLPQPAYKAIKIVLLLSVIGLLKSAIKSFKERKINDVERTVLLFILSNVIYLSLFVTWDFFFRQKNGFSFGFQGRYFFPLIVTQFSIIIYGLHSLSTILPRHLRKIPLLVFVVLVVLFNDFTLAYLANSYYDTSSLSIFLTQMSQYKPVILKGIINAVLIIFSLVFQFLLFLQLAKFIIKHKNGY